MTTVLPQLSFELLWRYCVRAVLFPIMPIFVCLFKSMLWFEETYHWIRDTYRDNDNLVNPMRKSIDPKTKLEIPHLVTYQSFYFTARDGTRLAVDVWLPHHAQEGSKFSTVFHQARYYRSARMSQPIHLFRANKPYNMISQEYFDALLHQGMAVVSMDLRGSGASFGTHKGPWLEEESEDSVELMNWILSQPWCNGRLGVWGISYEATAALLSATLCPQVEAVVAMYPFLDMYNDVGFMGGLCLRSFIDNWQTFNDKLDLNRVGSISWLSWLFFDHVSPVPGEEHVLAEAIHGHRLNWRSSSEAPFISYCDDTSPATGLSPCEAGPYVRVGEWLRERRTDPSLRLPAFLVVSGWYDTSAACALRLVEQLRDLTDVSLIVGPWNHAGTQHVRTYPGGKTSMSQFDHPMEVAAFFARTLLPADTDAAPGPAAVPEAYHPLLTAPHSVRYFNLQQETWRHDHTFPVPDGVSDSAHALSLFLGCAANGRVRSLLSSTPFAGEQSESRSTLSVDPSRDIGAAGVSRYHAMTQLFDRVSYQMQDSRRINHLRYTSPPLAAPLDVTGFVVVSLWVSSSVDDAALFAYLEAVDPRSGKGYYVTEGMMRVSNRVEEEPSPDNILHFPNVPPHSFRRRDARFLTPGVPVQARFALLPTSFRFQKGQALRLSIGGADASHFSPLAISPAGPHKSVRYSLTLHAGGRYQSQVFLPTPNRDPAFVFPIVAPPQ